MGTGVCSRRQRRVFQCLLVLTVVCGLFYGGMVSYEMHQQLRRTEAMALKYQQHQESLSAQLQVVYEHRSRLEKSLQKERLEHKKAKEDYLSYKLEAQQSLNKEKDSISRMNSLQVQHQILKNQHEDLKKQYYDLQDQHHAQGDDHNQQLDEHRERYDKLQQIKELEVSQLKDSIFNLREENKQLRKAHHDIHTQLQDAQVRHQDLKAAHDQLALNLQDHKSALAAAQVQVDEYKQLKESLNAASNLGQQQPNAAPNLPSAPQSHDPKAQKDVDTDVDLPHKDEPGQHPGHEDTKSRLGEQVQRQHSLSDKEGEAERRRELEEEEMAQAGQPQKLEEDLDQPQQEEEDEPEPQQSDENAVDRDRAHSQQGVHQQQSSVERIKSSFDQRLEAQRAEERRRIQLRQGALQLQREREQRMKEERQQHSDKREQRKRTGYENSDTVPEEGHRTNDEDRDTHLLNEEEEMKVDHKALPPHQGAVDGELDPEDDPNNQGEDEFDEAEDEQAQHKVTEEEEEEEEEEPAAPAQRRDVHPGHEPAAPAVEEELVMAGNPDQQEDPVDDQYQEDLEDEAQEDVAGGQKRDVEEEDPYNEENMGQAGPKKVEDHENEDNYDEEEEEGEGVRANKGTNRRAEM